MPACFEVNEEVSRPQIKSICVLTRRRMKISYMKNSSTLEKLNILSTVPADFPQLNTFPQNIESTSGSAKALGSITKT